MTKNEELRYLIGLLQSAAQWRLSEGDERSPIELECDSRINALMGEPDEIVDGRVQNTPEAPRKKPVHMRKNATERSREYRNGKVKVKGADGKPHWTPVEQCEQVSCKFSKTGLKWQLKAEV